LNRRLASALLLLPAAAACRGAAREPLLTYFNGNHMLSMQYPASWRSEEAVQEGFWYRYFLAPPAGDKRKPAVSVTLLVGALGGSVEDYAQSYLAGNTVQKTADAARGASRGKTYLFQSPDAAIRYSLMLLKEGDRVYGLYAQGEPPHFERYQPLLEEMQKSLTLERPASYPEQRNERFAFALRLPPSWKETRQFSGAGSLLLQYRSPALAADRDRDPVHASLTLSVEPIPDKGGVREYYDATRSKLGESYQLLSHNKWKDGYADVMRTETPVTTSRVKRFYRADSGRGYSMTFEARDDVFGRVSRWSDVIAETLRVGEETRASQ
jgi:hypothetical protein